MNGKMSLVATVIATMTISLSAQETTLPTAEAPARAINAVNDGTFDQPNSVPTRIETSYYGEELSPGRLRVECYIDGEENSFARVTGGEPGATVALFCAEEPAEVRTPWGLLLVPINCEVIPGVFNDRGMFDVVVNLGRKALCENTFYFQAAELNDGTPTLSWGFKVRYVHGNLQPRIYYQGPAAQAILCKNVSKFVPTDYRLLVRFEAAASYELQLDEVYDNPATETMSVYATLHSPGEPWGPNRWHRAVADLGPLPRPTVELWVSAYHGGPCMTFERAAVVKTKF